MVRADSDCRRELVELQQTIPRAAESPLLCRAAPVEGDDSGGSALASCHCTVCHYHSLISYSSYIDFPTSH